MKPKKIFAPLVLVVCLSALPSLLVLWRVLEYWELTVYDVFCRSLLTEETSDKVAIVLIDDHSIEWGRDYYRRHGHLIKKGVIDQEEEESEFKPAAKYLWPWKRSVYELIITYLIEHGARIIAFDLDFSSPHNSGNTEDDVTLADAITFYHEEGVVRVIHTINFHVSENPPKDYLTASGIKCLGAASVPVQGMEHTSFPFHRADEGAYYDPILPYEDLVGDALGGSLRLGAVVAQPDSDAVIRRARILTRYEDWNIPSLGLAAVLAYFEHLDGRGQVELQVDEEGLIINRKDAGMSIFAPLTPSGDILVHWKDSGLEGYEGEGRYKTYPAFRILLLALDAYFPKLIEEFTASPEEAARFRKVDEDDFKDKIVFIGANALALYDLKATPIAENYPGVKVHAAVAENLLEADPLRRLPLTGRAVAASVLTFFSMLIFLALRKASLKFIAALAITAAYALSAYMLFTAQLLWIDALGPMLGVFLAYTGSTTYSYLTEGRQKRHIIRMFQHYAPPNVVDRLAVNPEALNTRGDRVEITAFFSDIRGFTRLSNTPEMRENPDRLTEHLNHYLTEMTAAIHHWGGTLDKYIGDAVVAFFGAPLPMENHSLAACRAALACQKRIADFNVGARSRGLPEFQTRMGLYTGDAMVGNVGSRVRLSYTAIGSTVNFGSRLEGVNKTYGTWILAGGTTVKNAGNSVRTRFIDLVRVPGVEEDAPPLEVHQVVGMAGDLKKEEEELLIEFNRAMEKYRSGRFDDALPLFETCARKYDDPPSNIFAQRSIQLAQNPPEPWDGVWRIHTK